MAPEFSLVTPTLRDLDLKGKRVLVRVDFNVPQDASGAITDDTRIRAALPTIQEILKQGGHPILMSHLGRPKGKVVEALRLVPMGERLEELAGVHVTKLDDCIGAGVVAAIARADPKGIVLLENVRFHDGDEKSDVEFARELAANGDVFVNDAFGSSHRDHASVCGVARLLPSCAGLLLEREIAAFKRVLEEPELPYVAILGGAKISDKLAVIDALLDRVTTLLVGGGMAYTLLAANGYRVGKSLVQVDQVDAVKRALAKAARLKVEVCLPEDHVCAAAFGEHEKAVAVDGPDIPGDLMGLDIGPKTRAKFASRIRTAKTVVWNGPMGVFEWPSFRDGTAAVGQAVAACAGYTVIGGGDSVAAIEMLGLASEIKHISTGGGASLELLEGTLLPGIAALQRAGPH
ncbi:MAG: phosphoglycerate kinase [Planctomycetes bacterium]|nr:phosphoglycerate kinase [Planctomycetota bacterium]